ncbi:hypothetical protein QR680_018688 [Steinernema hermaphroditum]|uniref:Uncharacterized protein n=1 Tax=Steinernema hermaphroditum TaxID=289476 RepID=A0AA39HIQ7_9BILA|nr:hypothetical protein QR680_018688 [Steinernema hermaphroditum]
MSLLDLIEHCFTLSLKTLTIAIGLGGIGGSVGSFIYAASTGYSGKLLVLVAGHSVSLFFVSALLLLGVRRGWSSLFLPFLVYTAFLLMCAFLLIVPNLLIRLLDAQPSIERLASLQKSRVAHVLCVSQDYLPDLLVFAFGLAVISSVVQLYRYFDK